MHLAPREVLRGLREDGLELGVLVLLAELLGPVAGHPVVAAAVVNLLHLARGVLVRHEEGAHRL